MKKRQLHSRNRKSVAILYVNSPNSHLLFDSPPRHQAASLISRSPTIDAVTSDSLLPWCKRLLDIAFVGLSVALRRSARVEDLHRGSPNERNWCKAPKQSALECDE